MDKSGSGITFLGLLFLLFLGLKLGHVISWSWWFVFMPLYAPIIIALIILIFMIIFAKHKMKKIFHKRR